MASYRFQCSECRTSYRADEVELVCPKCAELQEPGREIRGILLVVLDDLPRRWSDGPSSLEFNRAFWPISVRTRLPPLRVGDTPLLPVPGLRRALGLAQLWVKDDSRNPSGSTKDRASLLVVAKALEAGRDTVATASSGNAAAALAAIAAAAELRAVLFVPEDAPAAKILQMRAYGADVVPVTDSYDVAYELCLDACREFGWYNRNTALNPFTIEGKKSAAVEIAYQIAPEEADVVVVPSGDGAVLAGLAKGFSDLQKARLIRHVPRLICVQPENACALVDAWRRGDDTITPLEKAHTVADSLRVAVPRAARLTLRSIRETQGAAVAVEDEAILAAIHELARTTGLFVEPAAAASLAGLKAALEQGFVDRDERIVLMATGSGLKDLPAASRALEAAAPAPASIEPHLDAVRERLELP